MSFQDWIYWLTLAILWLTIFLKARDLRITRRERQERQEQDMTRVQLAEYTGLTELQIQVAMDAAMTAFHTRIHEMKEAQR